MLGLALLSILTCVTALGPFAWQMDPNTVRYDARFVPPSWAHPFGTDNIGRDYFARSLHGGRISLSVGFVAMAISVLVGTLVGAAAGYLGGTADNVLMRLVDFALSLPLFFIILVVQVTLTPHIVNVMLIIGLTSWMGVSRIVRGEVLSQSAKEYVLASVAVGNSSARTVVRHILPNIVGPLTVVATLNTAQAILVESALSFLGFGVQPPHASWGSMVSGGQTRMFLAPWVVLFPGAMLVLTIMGFNLFGDGLRDALDPRSDRRAL